MIYKRKINNFLLLEVIIAFSLIFLFTFPFLKRPYSLFLSEKKQLAKIERERIAYLSFSEILDKIYQKEFTLKELKITSKEKAPIYSLPEYKSYLGMQVKRKYQLISKSKKISKDNTSFNKIKIVLSLIDDASSEKFYYYFLIESHK